MPEICREAVARGLKLAGAYVKGVYEESFGPPAQAQELLTDMLCDLRHLAAANKLDFEAAASRSEADFIAGI